MKKTFSLALAAALMLTMLAGCGGDAGSGSSAAPSAGTQASAEVSAAPAAEPGAEPDPVTINFPTATSGGALYAVGAAILVVSWLVAFTSPKRRERG